MKKFISGFIVGAMLFGSIGVLAVTYVANPVDFKVMVNGTEFVSDPPALEVNGSTYLPLRAMGDALGVPVNWNEELRQAEVGGKLAHPAEDSENEFYPEGGGNTVPSFGYLIKRVAYSVDTNEKDKIVSYTYTLDSMLVAESKEIVNLYKVKLTNNGFKFSETDGIYEYYRNSEKTIGVGISKTSNYGYFTVMIAY